MNFQKVISVLLLSSIVVAACGCSDSGTPTEASSSPAAAQSEAPEEPLAAVDEKEDWPKKITIVQMPNEANPDAGQKQEGFRKAASDYIGVEVEEQEGTEYAVGIEAMKSGKLDVLLVSPMSYYQAKKVANAEPLVKATTFSATPYKTVFITRADRSDINSLEDLQGKTFAFVDPASSSGYLYPKAKLIAELGLETEQLENPGYFFQTVAYSGKHDSSAMGVVLGDYDAAAVALSVLGPMTDAELFQEEDIKIIGETDVIPDPCYVIRSDLPQTLKDKIKEFYLQYDSSEYFEIFYSSPDARFVEAKDADYEIVAEMVELLKIEE
ncbi:MAG: phosphate/phosphite/phosphonate ABC transporter substrate-binding protein [Clostridium sp.]|nr:phosphate/phosphite/phosphonate ABC transporter substrate-binding protein [Clostridium sp.]